MSPVYLFDQTALYTRESDLRLQCPRTGKWIGLVGQGLFSIADIPQGEAIAYFKGEVITKKENDRRIASNPDRAGYQVKLTKKYVLDCYDNRMNRTCMASFSNDYRYCIDVNTGRLAVPNSRLVVVNRKHRYIHGKKLRYAYLLALQDIPAMTEITNYYGPEFEFPEPTYHNFVDLSLE